MSWGLIVDSGKKPFSALVGEAVDQLNIRDYYKWANNRKIAIHVKELMKILLGNHQKSFSQQDAEMKQAEDIAVENSSAPSSALVVHKSIDMWLQQLTEQYGVASFYTALPSIMMSSPNIAPHDRLLCQTVMSLMVALQFNVENDIELVADPVTEIITTTIVPDRKQIRHYIDKKGAVEKDDNVGFKDRNKLAGRCDVEELYSFNLKTLKEDIGIDDAFKDMRLKRIVQWGVNILSHTPFEYFHQFERFDTNDKERPVYLLRTYLRKGKWNEKTSSIVAFLDKDYNFLNPDFPVIDDAQSNAFIVVNAFTSLNVGRAANNVFFFTYKNQLYLIKKGKYVLPGFADDIADTQLYHLIKHEEKKWYFHVKTEKERFITDSHLRVLGKTLKEVEQKLLALKKK